MDNVNLIGKTLLGLSHFLISFIEEKNAENLPAIVVAKVLHHRKWNKVVANIRFQGDIISVKFGGIISANDRLL